MAGVEQGREAFARRAWSEAFAALQDATEPGDLELLATAAALVGRDAERVAALERAHQGYLAAGNEPGAARTAFWLGMALVSMGEMARGGGWFARAHRVLGDVDCVEQGYLLAPQALQVMEADPAAAHASFTAAAAVADRFDDADLRALSRLGQGQSLLRQGHANDGVALLDEAMVSVQAGEVSAIPSGIIYCAVIASCHAVSDLRRAQEWTSALSEWCASQPDMVPFRGQCLVHRSQILQLHGEWTDAMHEALQACEHLPANNPAVGAAHYQRGELHRLRGEFDQAEEAYRAAHERGHSPQPGLARLRLAQGQTQAAAAGLRRALDADLIEPARSTLLAAAVEIALAADDIQTARAAADELIAMAAEQSTPLLQAVSAHVEGAVLLVEGNAPGAVAALQRAASLWREVDAPYESARARVLVGLACRELGDTDAAEMELDVARQTFAQLGAVPELARLATLTSGRRGSDAGGLTDRELEVLRLIAAGKSNRAIAEDLVISGHTVARHVQNIFSKLGVASRTAAAGFAFEHDLT